MTGPPPDMTGGPRGGPYGPGPPPGMVGVPPRGPNIRGMQGPQQQSHPFNNMGPGNGPYGPPPVAPGMRPPPPNASMGGNGGLPPMSMGGPGRPWQPNPNNFSSPSPGSHYGGGPGTPLGMYGPSHGQSPSGGSQGGPYSPANHRMTGTPGSVGGPLPGSGPDGMYGPGMGPGMKFGPMGPSVPHLGGQMGPGDMVGPEMRGGPGSVNTNDGMDGMKVSHSPVNGSGTPMRDDSSTGPPGDYGGPMSANPYGSGQGMGDPGGHPDGHPDVGMNDVGESAAIRKIKESMQEEAKRFEKETGPDHESQFFMQ